MKTAELCKIAGTLTH